MTEVDYGKRYRCEIIEQAILRQEPSAVAVHLHRDFVVIQYRQHCEQYPMSAQLLDILERHEMGEEIQPVSFTLEPRSLN